LNQRLFLAIGVLSVGLILGFSLTVSAQENLIPSWIKNTAGWWSEGSVSDSDFISSIQWLIDNKVLQVSNTEDSEWKSQADKLYKENQQLEGDIGVLENDVSRLLKENQEIKSLKETNQILRKNSDLHYEWYLEEFDLRQEWSQWGAVMEKQYAEVYDAYLYYYIQSIGSDVGSSQYQQQPSTQSTTPSQQEPQQTSCDPSYPDVCIPAFPPDLDCGEIQFANFKVLQPDPHRFDGDKDGIGCESSSSSSTTPQQDCSGSARCISGTVTRIVDADTIHVDGQSIRFALASAPEPNESGGQEAKQFVEKICPVGSKALVDEDDGQTGGSNGRIVAVIYCNGVNLNEAIIEEGHG